jgi:hypothetical protein
MAADAGQSIRAMDMKRAQAALRTGLSGIREGNDVEMYPHGYRR